MTRIIDIKDIDVGDIIIIKALDSEYLYHYTATEVHLDFRLLTLLGFGGTHTRTINNSNLRTYSVYIERTSLFNKELSDILGTSS